MADTPKEGETVTPETLKNEAEPIVAPVVVASQPVEKTTEDPEVERLKKEKEQAEMRANQLQNKLDAEEKAKADAKAKELEEQNEFKTLYEQEKAKREEIEAERLSEERKKELQETTVSVLGDYSDEVKALAEDTGLSLGDVSEDAVADFKAKLDKIQTRIGNTQVTPNNPGRTSGKKEYSREEMHEILNDPVKRDAYYRQQGGVTAMMMGQSE